jgi:hypothetical protein
VLPGQPGRYSDRGGRQVCRDAGIAARERFNGWQGSHPVRSEHDEGQCHEHGGYDPGRPKPSARPKRARPVGSGRHPDPFLRGRSTAASTQGYWPCWPPCRSMTRQVILAAGCAATPAAGPRQIAGPSENRLVPTRSTTNWNFTLPSHPRRIRQQYSAHQARSRAGELKG